MGSGMTSSPRRALDRIPPRSRARTQWSFSLADLPFHPEYQPVVEAARVVEAVLVADEGAGHGADFEELVPVGVVAGQPGAFQAEHDPGPQ